MEPEDSERERAATAPMKWTRPLTSCSTNSGSTIPAKTEYENTTAGIYGIAAGDAGAGEDVVVYLTGEFFADAINLPDSVTAETLTTAFRNIGIFLK